MLISILYGLHSISYFIEDNEHITYLYHTHHPIGKKKIKSSMLIKIKKTEKFRSNAISNFHQNIAMFKILGYLYFSLFMVLFHASWAGSFIIHSGGTKSWIICQMIAKTIKNIWNNKQNIKYIRLQEYFSIRLKSIFHHFDLNKLALSKAK